MKGVINPKIHSNIPRFNIAYFLPNFFDINSDIKDPTSVPKNKTLPIVASVNSERFHYFFKIGIIKVNDKNSAPSHK